MNLELFVCMVIGVFGIMKGPDGTPGPVRPPPLGGSEMILLDRLLLGAITLLTLILAVLTHRLVRKDPMLWLTPKVWDIPRLWCREVWSFFEKPQPEQNRGL